MFEKMIQKRISGWTLSLLFLMLCVCFSTVLAGEIEGGDSPQAVFQAAQKAGAQKDFGALAKLVAPSEHAMLAFGTDMAVGMFVEFYEGEKAAELKNKYEKVQNKYQIKCVDGSEGEALKITQDTPQQVINAHLRKRAEKFYGYVDAVTYVPELMGIVVSLPEMADQTFIPQEKLVDLLIDGDHAAGSAGEKSIGFIREGGRWYLSAEIMN